MGEGLPSPLLRWRASFPAIPGSAEVTHRWMTAPTSIPTFLWEIHSSGLEVVRGHLLRDESGLRSGRSPVGERPDCEELPVHTVPQSAQPTFPTGDHHWGLNWALSHHIPGSRSQQETPDSFLCPSSAPSQSCLQPLSCDVQDMGDGPGPEQGHSWAPSPPPHRAPPPGSPAHLPGQQPPPGGTWPCPGC